MYVGSAYDEDMLLLRWEYYIKKCIADTLHAVLEPEKEQIVPPEMHVSGKLLSLLCHFVFCVRHNSV